MIRSFCKVMSDKFEEKVPSLEELGAKKDVEMN